MQLKFSPLSHTTIDFMFFIFASLLSTLNGIPNSAILNNIREPDIYTLGWWSVIVSIFKAFHSLSQLVVNNEIDRKNRIESLNVLPRESETEASSEINFI